MSPKTVFNEILERVKAKRISAEDGVLEPEGEDVITVVQEEVTRPVWRHQLVYDVTS